MKKVCIFIPRLVLVFGIAIALLPDRCDAAHIYNLVDYPDLQNGYTGNGTYTVSGTITVSDSAPEDGLLATEEILDWEWEARNGLEVITGLMHPTEPHSSSLTEVVGIEIDSQGVYFSHELGRIFKLQINTNTNSRGSNTRRLAWTSGFPDFSSRYGLSGITEGDIGFLAWGTDLPANPDRWLIAERVPEPSGLTLSCCVIAYAAAMLRRARHG